MAICDVCTREMTEADSCLDWRARIRGKAWRVLRYGNEPRPEPPDEWDDELGDAWSDEAWLRSADRPPAEPDPWPDRCGDCHVALGAHHHPGCDLARCPRCGRQLISCGCWDGEVVVPET